MNTKKREAVIASLKAGNRIMRRWKGENRSGYLSHSLEGISRLTKKEVDALRKEGVIDCVKENRDAGGYLYGSFKPLEIKSK